MANGIVLKCYIRLLQPCYCVTRIIENEQQTLVSNPEGARLLLGSDTFGGLRLGPRSQFFEARAADTASTAPRRALVTRRGIHYPTWDTWSASVYAVHGNAIVHIRGDEVSVVAGSVTERGKQDGAGSTARFLDCSALVSNGAGALYFAPSQGKLRKVQLPAGLGAAVQGPWPGGEAVVSTLPVKAEFTGLVHVPDPAGGPGSLVYSTMKALYRVRLGSEGVAAASVLLAGREEEEGSADGRGEEACFMNIFGMKMDAERRIICADIDFNRAATDDEDNDDDSAHTTSVRCVAPDGTVTTLAAAVNGHSSHPLILPNECLAMCEYNYGRLVVLALGLKPQPLTAPPPATSIRPQPGSLSADWATLFDTLVSNPPEATSDYNLVAGGRVFPVHRLVLSVRCEYFGRCLVEGAFTEGNAAKLYLPDADPDALGHVIRFIYTGAVDNMPSALACAVAELADRLMLPLLTTAACEQVRMCVAPETVVDLLFWAERCAVRGGSFLELLTDLKTWYVQHYKDVKRVVSDSQQRLAAAGHDDRGST